MGKSTALGLERVAIEKALADTQDTPMWVDLREFQTDQRLAQKVFDSRKMEEWRKGSHTLHLFFDSLDEALLRIENIAAVLSSELRELPAERLRLRIACRAADWPGGLEATLRTIWTEGHVGVFLLVPLRRTDVVVAAKSTGIDDPDAFLHDVDILGVAPLANRPVTLRFLMNSFKRGGSLPTSRTELYREGCKCLCEPSENRRDAKAIGKLTPGQRVEVAGRLAAVTQFSNRFAIWTGPNEGDIPDEDVLLTRLIGGKEGDGPTETRVDTAAVRETLDTGLFSSRRINQLGWAHQTYAEFLAAHYLHGRKMPAARMLQLLQHQDGSGKVVPQLRETAAWLASMNPWIFRALAKTDPETLLRGDMAGAACQDRAELVRQLLASFESGDLLDDHSLWQYYASLTSPDLAGVLRPYLQDSSRAASARLAAIGIARACKLTTLQFELVSIALDASASYRVRIRAASAVGEVGDAVAKGALKPLLAETTGDDPEDELKGCALRACWPDQVTAEDLFAALTPPKDPHLIGVYHAFLHSDVAASLRAQDFAVALPWAKNHLPGNADLDPLSKLASEILARALDHLNQPGTSDLVAQALNAQWEFCQCPEKVAERLRDSADARRLVLRSMLPLVAASQHGALTLLETCAITSRDVPWLLSELKVAQSGGEQQVLSSAIARILNFNDVDIVDEVLRARESNPFLDAAIRPLIDAVPLDSPQAEEMRAWYQRQQQYTRTPKQSEQLPDAQSIEDILNKRGVEAFLEIWAVDWPARQRHQKMAEPLVGWSGFDRLLRARILEAAHRYLTDYRSVDNRAWWREGRFPPYALAAYRALSLLCVEGPALFAALGEDLWAVWAWIAVSYPFNDSEGREVQERILRSAFQRAPDAVLQVLDEVIDGENERDGTISVFQHFSGLWTDRVAKVLRGKLSSGALKPGSFRVPLSKLLEKGDVAARAMAEAVIAGQIPAAGPKRDEAIATAQELIRHSADGAWPLVWPALQADREFGLAVLQGLYGNYPEGPGLAANLNEDQIVDLLIWLPFEKTERDRGGSGAVTPEWAFARWRESLLGHLADRGTPKACQAIQRVIAARPELYWLKWYLKNAQELTRRNTWVPIPPEELIRLGSSASARWIRDGNDLTEVVVESLGRLQALLQGETPAAIDLWNETGRRRDDATKKGRKVFTPKDEPALSDYIKRHLDQDLRDRGAIVNREVEIRRSFGGAPGERPDILVNVGVPATEPNTPYKVTVIIEVKCCWHEALCNAMRIQLVDRYMKDNECRHGIYVVGWFECGQWDPDDNRRTRGPKISIEDAQRQFESQAAALSTGGILVRAVVLNAELR
ncbi:MAG: hypothetical protein ABSH05_13700 [Bryobacteraceae bacterium]